jgi:DNA-binding response OmpR family regulator
MKKILIVDDEFHIRALLSETLEEVENIEIFTADNGKSGIDLINKINPDLVFLDVVLPEYSGYDILKYIREHNELNKIKVFLLTAKGQEKDKRKGIEMGADCYVTKPFDPDFLLQKTCDILEIFEY